MLTASSRIMARIHDFPRYDLRKCTPLGLSGWKYAKIPGSWAILHHTYVYVAVSATRALLGKGYS